MIFCTNCGLIMQRDSSMGRIVFTCACGEKKDGTPEDARIESKSFGSSEDITMYQSIIKNAAHDRTNQVVSKQCTNCPLNYMVQVRVGSAEIIVHVCKCGNVVHS